MTITIQQFISLEKEKIEQKLTSCLQSASIPEILHDSMQYSLLAGGKRLRPILLLASFCSFSSEIKDKCYQSAIALEMIHTYSLIHDDLPAMDDDDYRRGKLTNHKKFDEATAILAGDALLTYSFELISEDDLLTNEEKVALIQMLAKASGPNGMVGGQTLDLEGENKQLTLEQLEEIHTLKTGALIKFAIFAGAYLAELSNERLQHLDQFSHYLGLIFQVQDDILDVIGDEEKLGKAVGSDIDNEKSTYPNLLSLSGAKKQKEKYLTLAKTALQKADPNNDYLQQLLYLFSERDH